MSALQSSPTRQSIELPLGDTLDLRYAIRTDTVLRVTGNRIAPAHCGKSMVFFRTVIGTLVKSSDTVDVTVPCATHLAILVQPPDTVISGQPFSRAPVVQLRDANDRPVRQSGVVVTVTLNGPGQLAGTVQGVTNEFGVATFLAARAP